MFLTPRAFISLAKYRRIDMLFDDFSPKGFKVIKKLGGLTSFYVTCGLGAFGPSGRQYTFDDAVEVVRDVIRKCVLDKNFFYIEGNALPGVHIEGWEDDEEGVTSREDTITFIGHVNEIRFSSNPEPFWDFCEKLSNALVSGVGAKVISITDEHGCGPKIAPKKL